MSCVCTAHGTALTTYFICPNQKFIWLTVFGLFSIFESSFRSAALMLFTLKNFQGCIVVYLSRFKPMLSHRFCCSFCDSFVRLPQVFQLVNNFFKVFCNSCVIFCRLRTLFCRTVFPGNECEYITVIPLCQHLFFNLFK